jgi:menaquinone-dependent protoporphyrinogen oxidase
MKVLVSAASKYGSTAEIGETVAETLRSEGIEADAVAPDDVRAIDEYDAFVFGSGVYVGHWLPAAQHLIERNRAALAGRPIWLFSSGPIGDPPLPKEHAVDVDALMQTAGAREHRLFAGRLDKQRLSFPERAVVFALRVHEGDFRDWDEIRAWARAIAAELKQAPVQA